MDQSKEIRLFYAKTTDALEDDPTLSLSAVNLMAATILSQQPFLARPGQRPDAATGIRRALTRQQRFNAITGVETSLDQTQSLVRRGLLLAYDMAVEERGYMRPLHLPLAFLQEIDPEIIERIKPYVRMPETPAA